MSDTENDSASTARGDALSDDQLEAVAGGNILDDLAATAAWLAEQAKKRMQEIMDAANGGPSVQ